MIIQGKFEKFIGLSKRNPRNSYDYPRKIQEIHMIIQEKSKKILRLSKEIQKNPRIIQEKSKKILGLSKGKYKECLGLSNGKNKDFLELSKENLRVSYPNKI